MMESYIQLCNDLFKKYKLHNWKCTVNKEHNEWSGICRHSYKRIELSHYLFRCSDEYILDTILHEVAHAIVGYEQKHGSTWQRVAREIGCSGEIHGAKISEKYLAICGNCGYHHTRSELPFNNKLSCFFCCEKHSNGLYNSKFQLNYKTHTNT
jgi:hypothetical protein